MYVFKISLRSVRDGTYKRKMRGADPWARYFHERGATCYLEFGDPELVLQGTPVQDVVDLMYSARRYGIDGIELSLDEKDSIGALQDAIGFINALPEISASCDFEQDPPILRAQFAYGRNMEDQVKDFFELSDQELDGMFDRIEASEGFQVTLPEYICDRYGLAKIYPKPLDIELDPKIKAALESILNGNEERDSED